MTVASGEVNMILFIMWRKWNLQHHSMADVIPSFSECNIPFQSKVVTGVTQSEVYAILN